MRTLHRVVLSSAAALSLAAALLAAARPALALADFTKEPHIAVLLTTDAKLMLNGKPATLQQTERAVDKLKEQGGVFWYARQNGTEDPSPQQQQVFEALFAYVMKAQLPIRLFTDGTFTTIVSDP